MLHAVIPVSRQRHTARHRAARRGQALLFFILAPVPFFAKMEKADSRGGGRPLSFACAEEAASRLQEAGVTAAVPLS